MNDSLAKAVDLIHLSQRIIIGAHVEPDPDCIGSMFGLGLGLEDLGKSVICVDDHPIPHNVHCLPDGYAIVNRIPDGFNPDLFIGVDSSDPERLGEVAQPFLDDSLPAIIIDHHQTNTGFGTVNYTDTSAASTAEIIPVFLDALGVTITPRIAVCLLTGLVADTLGFSTENIRPSSLITAARFVAAGADIADITYRTLKAKPLALMQLWGVGLSHLRYEEGIIWSQISSAERQALGIPDDLNHNLASQIRNINEGELFAVFAERDDGAISVSLRSKPGYDVSWIAFSLGGGGHKPAAGATIAMSMSEAIDTVLPLLREEYRKKHP